MPTGRPGSSCTISRCPSTSGLPVLLAQPRAGDHPGDPGLPSGRNLRRGAPALVALSGRPDPVRAPASRDPHLRPLKKWMDEGRPMTKETATYPKSPYRAHEPDANIRALRDSVLQSLRQPGKGLVDVRSPREFSGELLAPENLPQEGAQRGGHIPGAANIPWGEAVRPDGTFKSADELKALYQGRGITPDKEVIAYCRIGERSAHTWFVLKELLGYPKVRNYDGSWTEWGSMVGVPVER
ncbi:MAG: sulfurtransferase [candidate division NC10 bacterium]|nr:sulfurtransferase [candidate division NC10 bacterium]